jgi:hypothetical protein
MNRRKLITGLIAFGTTPAIVRASSLMKINPLLLPISQSDKVTFEYNIHFIDCHPNMSGFQTYFIELTKQEVLAKWPYRQNN